jgi:hypothetical protein
MTIEQRIAQQLGSTLTDAEFDVLEAEAAIEPHDEGISYCTSLPEHDEVPFRDGGDVPAAQPAIPLDHDGRGPRVDTRCDCGYPLTEHIGGKPCVTGKTSAPRGLYDLPLFGWAWAGDAAGKGA